MVRKVFLFLCAAMIPVLLAIPVNGAEEGMVRVKLDPGDLAATNGEVTLYYVGVPSTEGYQVTEAFGGGLVKAGDALSPHLARWMSQATKEKGVSRLLDADGQATFSHLPDGLYLLVQTQSMDGFYPIQPIMVTIPCQNAREIVVAPTLRPIVVMDSPATGQTFSPLIAAMVLVLSGAGLYWCVEKQGRNNNP